MNAYNPLYAHLSKRPDPEWLASFGDVERVLGRSLPASARRHRAWWSNQTGAGHSQARAWREAGWRIGTVSLTDERVEFRREQRRDLPAGKSTLDDLLIEASRLTAIDDRQTLMREGLAALIDRENARRLIALGGSMPEFEAAPRRRDA